MRPSDVEKPTEDQDSPVKPSVSKEPSERSRPGGRESGGARVRASASQCVSVHRASFSLDATAPVELEKVEVVEHPVGNVAHEPRAWATVSVAPSSVRPQC